PATKSLRYRVDNGDEQSCDNPCNLATLVTGTHLVGLYAVDAAGNAHDEIGTTIKVDTKAPHTTVAMHSPTPDGLNGWYLSLPYIEIGADDQPADYDNVLPNGSGVFKTEYQLDGGAWQPYTGAFQIAGEHTLCARSIDNAGLVEAAQCVGAVKGDDKNPTTSLSVAGTPGLNGWYTSNVTLTVTASDPVPGSGLVQPGAPGSPCYDAIPVAPVPAGTCVSIDGRPFARSVGSYTLGEGVHTVLAYTVDAAGHRSTVVTTDVRIDKSNPYTTARTIPPYSAQNGWFRAVPRVVLRAADGDMNAGVAATYYKVDSGAYQPYTGPFDIQNGLHTVSYYSTDLAGHIEAVKSFNLKVDTTPPTVTPSSALPTIWLKVLSGLGNILTLSPKKAKLQWIVGDQYSGKLNVRVLIYDITGNVVRQLDCVPVSSVPQCDLYRPAQTDLPVNNPITITPGTSVGGYTLWDGKDLSLTGIVPVGLYFFRVVVIDDAGNVAQSGESKPIQIKVG
ncbi:MAG: large repetitive protein, partial [Pseudonocardiales bacterium]|nr:large repetitive protein [Pseudonocardiales bacterium]